LIIISRAIELSCFCVDGDILIFKEKNYLEKEDKSYEKDMDKHESEYNLSDSIKDQNISKLPIDPHLKNSFDIDHTNYKVPLAIIDQLMSRLEEAVLIRNQFEQYALQRKDIY
jgi:hypothetical protein